MSYKCNTCKKLITQGYYKGEIKGLEVCPCGCKELSPHTCKQEVTYKSDHPVEL